MNLTVLGGGAWGTAIAIGAARHHPTRLWVRDDALARRMHSSGSNQRYLPGEVLPTALLVSTDFDAAVAHAADGLVVVATPMAALAEMLGRIGDHAGRGGRHAGGGIVWLCKGLEARTGRLGHEIAVAVVPDLRVGVLSGPSFAIEVARQQPTALVVASLSTRLCADVVEVFHTDHLRVYTSNDPVGVEVGGAIKNVLAIATGIADGMSLGLNARAALITRGLAEMTRLGVALGAHAETFMGLSGLGDLVLTATGHLSRNRSVGQKLAEGLPLARILVELGHVAEGVVTAPVVLARAAALDVDMPIVAAVVAVLEGRLTPARALEQLMGRGARAEV